MPFTNDRPIMEASDRTQGITLAEMEELCKRAREGGAHGDARLGVSVVKNIKAAMQVHAPVDSVTFKW